MTDLHHTLEAAAALAASGLCWLCGAPCAGARCDDAAECFARQMALPGEPPRPTFDPAERAAEKQAARDGDARRLAVGEVTREELAAENGALSGLTVRVAWERAERLA